MHRAPSTSHLLACGQVVTTRARDTNSIVVRLRGEFDCSTVDRLVDRLGEAVAGDATAIVVDLTDVTLLDSATVRTLENAAAALSSRDRTLVLRAPSTFVRSVIQLCGASSLIESGAEAERGASPTLPWRRRAFPSGRDDRKGIMVGARSGWRWVGAAVVAAMMLVGGGGFVSPSAAAPVASAGVVGSVGSIETKGTWLAGPTGLTKGPDGNVWFASVGSATIARMTPSGEVTHFGEPGMRDADDLAAGADGNLWFTLRFTSEIGRITPTGTITRFSSGDARAPSHIAAGPDGNLWFTAWNAIGRITPAGVVTSFPVAGLSPAVDKIVAGSDALWFLGPQAGQMGRIGTSGDWWVVATGLTRTDGLAAGPDGNIWVTSNADNAIARVTPGGAVTTFTGPDILGPLDITAGPDGNLWFTSVVPNQAGSVGRITPTGSVTTFTGADIVHLKEIITGPDGNLWLTRYDRSEVVRLTTAGSTTVFVGDQIAAPLSITRGPDGNIWFANFWSDSIGRVTRAGVFTDFALPRDSQPSTVVAGSDGALWFASLRNNYIGRMTPDGQYQLFHHPAIDGPRDLAVGPDGAMWFVTGNYHKVGRITTSGDVTLVLDGVDGMSLVAGSDGNMWLGLWNGIGRLTPNGTLTTFGDQQLGATALVLGPDANVWFAGNDGIGFITPTGAITTYPGSGRATDLAVGPDGNLWYTSAARSVNRITPTGTVTAFTNPTMQEPTAITAGLHGELWFSDYRAATISTIRALDGEPPSPGASFHGFLPRRILDTRQAGIGFSGPVTAGTPRTLQVTGLGGPSPVPWGASSVVMNVTAVGSTANSFLRVSPSGGLSTSSNLNFGAGEVRANLVTVRLGDGGAVDIATAVGSTDVVADIVGYYDTTGGGRYNPLTPLRLLDSRTTTGAWNGPLNPGSTRDLVVRQPTTAHGVPPTATAVVANVTATNAAAPTFITAWPAGSTKPTSSNLNLGPGDNVANLVTLEIGSHGSLSFATSDASVDVIVDVVGYFDPTAGLWYHAIDPARVLDSRTGQGLTGALGSGVTRNLTIAGNPGGPVPAAARALLANLTVVEPTQGTFVAAFPGNVNRPKPYSNINAAPGQTVANLTAVGLAPDGSAGLYNHVGTTHLVADAVGYYSTSP